MEIFQALVLGLVQGASEFLPISSSGHLIVIPNLLSWQGVVDSLSFDVALHLGTSIAVVVYFWRDWLVLIDAFLTNLPQGFAKIWANNNSRLFVLILIGSVPAALFGLLLREAIEDSFRSNFLVAINLIIFALVLLTADRFSRKDRSEKDVKFLDAVLVGIAQAISLVPGVSRSGITISSGLFLGLNRESATKFSFLLSTPAILGATLLESKNITEGFKGESLSVFLIGFLAAAISGWFAIKFLLRFVKSNNFTVFVIYRIVVGVLILAMLV